MRTISSATLFFLTLLSTSSALAQNARWPIDVLRDTFGIVETDQIDYPMDTIFQGCPKRDCIPSIDNPGFIGLEDAAAMDAMMIADNDLVIGLTLGNVSRAYPAYILNHHEVVNDTVAGVPVAITYCPLCGSGVAFEREVAGKVSEFGVSGLLHNSDLILYDRVSGSLWQQITGAAIAGPQRGKELTPVAVSMTTWRAWRQAHPQTELLSHDDGRLLAYPDKQPYGNYASSPKLMFPANEGAGLILHPKAVVHGLRVNDQAFAVTQRTLDAGSPVLIKHRGMVLEWQQRPDGQVVVRQDEGNETLTPHRMFWFAWYSFNTDTVLHDQP